MSATTLTHGTGIDYGGVILDPTNTDIVYAVLGSGSLMRLELSTFNNFVVSSRYVVSRVSGVLETLPPPPSRR